MVCINKSIYLLLKCINEVKIVRLTKYFNTKNNQFSLRLLVYQYMV